MKSLYISIDSTVKDALKAMDLTGRKLLIVGSENNFRGLLTIGDLQRALLNDLSMETLISHVLRKDIVVADESESDSSIKAKMLEIRAEFMPIVKDNTVKRVVFWEDLFDIEKPPVKTFNIPVVIMAGGFGTRLKPLTSVMPKPLIPIRDKTMLEEIFDRFGRYGCDRFYISVNYKAELIEHYIESQNLPYNISYFREKKPMGTGGSLSLLRGKIDSTFFVSNCDILIEQDYSEILDYHKSNNNEITIVAALKHLQIAYGTIETGKNGLLTELVEKPEFTFKINSGMYLLEPHLLSEIPNNEFYHITDLIEKIKSEGRRVGVFPIEQNSWKDMGEWKTYLEQIEFK